MKTEVYTGIGLALGTPFIIELQIRRPLVAYVQEYRRDPAAGGLRGLGAHILVVGISHAQVAVGIDHTGHEAAAIGIDDMNRIGQGIVGAGHEDAAAMDGDAAMEFPHVIHDPGVAYGDVRLHHCRSRRMPLMILRMPLHWLAPTVIGARRPSARAQMAVRPLRLA